MAAFTQVAVHAGPAEADIAMGAVHVRAATVFLDLHVAAWALTRVLAE